MMPHWQGIDHVAHKPQKLQNGHTFELQDVIVHTHTLIVTNFISMHIMYVASIEESFWHGVD